MPNTYIGEGRPNNETNDCTVIALSYAFQIDYRKAYDIMAAAGRKPNKGISFLKLFGGMLPHKGNKIRCTYLGRKVTIHPRPGMTIETFRKTNHKGTYILKVPGHVFVIKDGLVLNQRHMRQRVQYFIQVGPVVE